MEHCPVPFAVWDLPWQDEEPHDVPHLDQQRQLVGVSVYHGQPYGKGSGAIVTSYNPQVAFVDGRIRPEGKHFELVMRGPHALGWAMVRQFTEALTVGRLEPPARSPTQDVIIQCGNTLVPAVELSIGIPEATVIVSADLLTYPIALGFWQWQVKLPALELAGFDWE